jgi:hypothetical protein
MRSRTLKIKIITCLVMMSCLNLFIMHDSFAASRKVLGCHQKKVNFEIGLLVSAIVTGIYFQTRDSKASDIYPSNSIPQFEQPKVIDKSLKLNLAMNLLQNIFVSPDKLIVFEW